MATDLNLVNFLLNEVIPRGQEWKRILEVGVGSYPVINQIEWNEGVLLEGIDKDPSRLEQVQLKGRSKMTLRPLDITAPKALNGICYDLIFDGHCLHELTEAHERNAYARAVYEGLDKHGLWAFEHAVGPVGTEEGFIYRGERVSRAIPTCRELEGWLIAQGFDIIFFLANSHHKFIFEAKRIGPLKSDPDRLRVIVKKKD